MHCPLHGTQVGLINIVNKVFDGCLDTFLSLLCHFVFYHGVSLQNDKRVKKEIVTYSIWRDNQVARVFSIFANKLAGQKTIFISGN